jgi:hypothetical protein
MLNPMNQSNQVRHPPASPKIVDKTEILAHLSAFRRDIDRSIHALPGIVSGVSCANVIQISMSLIWHIDGLKAALVDAMLKEGISIGENGNNEPSVPQYNPITVVHKITPTPYERQYEHQNPVDPLITNTREGQHHIYEAIKPVPIGRPIAPAPVVHSNYFYNEHVTNNSRQNANPSQHYSNSYDMRYHGANHHVPSTSHYPGYNHTYPPANNGNSDNGNTSSTPHNVALLTQTN